MILTAFLLTLALAGDARADADEEAHRLVHVLSYIANDYERAIAGGAVDNWDEYEEQLEMGEQAGRIAAGLELTRSRAGAPVRLTPSIDQLRTLMEQKADPKQVRAASEETASQVIEAFRLRRAPIFPPSAERGKALFAEHCAPCHGATGHADTERAAALDPKPFNFHDAKRADHLTAYRVVNTIRFGVNETAMVPLDFLSDAERWDLAFYALSLRWTGAPVAPVEKVISLYDLAVRSDASLALPAPAIAQLRTIDAFKLPVVEAPSSGGTKISPIFAVAGVLLALLVFVFLKSRIVLAMLGAGAVIGAGALMFVLTKPEPESFDLTLKVNSTEKIKEGYARLLTEKQERIVRFRENNEAFFPALPIAFRKEGARLEILTNPEVEATWEPERIFPLDQPRLEVRGKLEKPPFAVVVLYKSGEKTETALLERFHVAEEVVIEKLIERAVMALKVVRTDVPIASRFRALSARRARWLRGVADVEHLEPDETVLVLVDEEIVKEKGEEPAPYVSAAEEALPKNP